MAKTNLVNFYTKYGYKDTYLKNSLKESFSEEEVLVDSCFGILKKPIADN